MQYTAAIVCEIALAVGTVLTCIALICAIVCSTTGRHTIVARIFPVALVPGVIGVVVGAAIKLMQTLG